MQEDERNDNANPKLSVKLKLPTPSPFPQSEDKEKLLKIVIRKPDSAFSAPAGQLIMQRFPDIATPPYFLKALGLSSPEQLTTWGEKQYACLKLELEDMRNTLRVFGTSLSQQSDQLELMKARVHDFVAAQQQLLAGGKTAGYAALPAAYASAPYVKRKADDMIDDDLEAALADADGLGRPRPLDKSKSKGSSSSAPSKQQQQLAHQAAAYQQQQQQQQQQANVLKKRQQQQRSKSGTGSSKQQQRKKWRTSGSDIGDDDSDADDDPDVAPPPPAAVSRAHKDKHQFWIDMEPYFALFSQDDLNFLRTTSAPVDADIPPLGRYYRDVWAEQDQQLPAQSEAGDDGDDELGGSGSSMMLAAPGDLHQRLLSALLDDHVVVPGPSTAPGAAPTMPGPGLLASSSSADPSPVSTPAASPPVAAEPAVETTQFTQSLLDASCAGSGGLAVPLDVPPTYDYSRPWAVSLEARLRQELQAIGLLDEHDTTQREDDELCAELRRLYQELQQRVDENNAMRSKVEAVVEVEFQKHVEQAQKMKELYALEQQYFRALGKKKKRRAGFGGC
eukprot:TRINITY_DN856_c3_g1_i1.p1 TRINITY_DN856_c3_g1~~TRINITY_DN856_c3_g1_i1.p1  ORF type:complete len:561 (+),score=176.98 TRINITY_DN856_c3_g1_i1:197-1879(+)